MQLYTICSYSNLNQAIVLFESIQSHATKPFSFTCFLVDNIPEESGFSEAGFKLVKVAELSSSLPDFSTLKLQYNAFELCCALKSFCGETMMKTSSQDEVLVYLDSDILFYNDIKLIEDEMTGVDILLTPHFTNPPPDFEKISELDVNNSGLYNGGFVAFRNNKTGNEFIAWWKERMKKYCFTDFRNGMFVDQVWLNFVPLYFQQVLISKHQGLNVAYWNFHERTISQDDNKQWRVNNVPLVFLHFSGYRLYRKDLISIHQTRYSFVDLPKVKTLFDNYTARLEETISKHNFEFPQLNASQRLRSKVKAVLKNPFKKK